MLLTVAFMQRALIAALIAGLVSPAVGTYIVQRRLSLLGDGLGHVAIAGVGLALATGLAPLPVAVIVAIAGAVVIELLRSSGKTSADVAMAILFYGGLATGVLLAGIAGQGTGALSAYLFGSLLTISTPDLILIAVLGALVFIPAVGLVPQLFAVCTDEDYARVLGLPVRFYNLLIVVLASVTITVSMRTVGLLMVSALMVVPVATANNLVTGFRRAHGLSMVLGVIAAAGGVIGSAYFNAPPGSLIVVLAIIIFIVTLPLTGRFERTQRRTPPADAGSETGLESFAADTAGPHPTRRRQRPHRHQHEWHPSRRADGRSS